MAGGPGRIDAPAQPDDDMPRILDAGAEYCPFCASGRWPMVVTLSGSGTWRLGADPVGR